MGRWHWDKKSTVEECRIVSISFLRKQGYSSGWRSGTISWKNNWGETTSSIGIVVSIIGGDNYARLHYTSTDRQTGEKTDYDYKVPLVGTPCNYGGVRWWFICPLTTNGVYCGRRVAKLHLPPSGMYLGCRHCYKLSYESRNESRLGRSGGLAWPIVIEGRIEKLYGEIKRWTYSGRPTRKARKLQALEARFSPEVIESAYRILFK